MSRCMVVSLFALLAWLALSPILCAQTAARNATGSDSKPATRDSIPPVKPFYAGKKSEPAPRRDISGIWDAAELDGGRQPSGALEHPALTAPRGKGVEGGRPDETGVV